MEIEGHVILSRRAQRRQELQEIEDLLNSGTLSKEQRRGYLLSQDIPGYSLSNDHVTIHKR